MSPHPMESIDHGLLDIRTRASPDSGISLSNIYDEADCKGFEVLHGGKEFDSRNWLSQERYKRLSTYFRNLCKCGGGQRTRVKN